MLSHYLATLGALALVLWAALHHLSEAGVSRTAANRIVRQLLPTVIALVLVMALWGAAYAANGYDLGKLGNPAEFSDRFLDQVGEMITLMFGVPFVPSKLAFLIATLFTAAAVVLLFARADPRGPLYVIMMFGVLGGLFSAAIPGQAYGRYYLFCLVFLIPLAAQGLAALWDSGHARRATAGVLMSVFISGSAWAAGHFLAFGRGNAKALLTMIAAGVPGGTLRVAVDHKPRFNLIFGYHAAPIARGLGIVPTHMAKVGADAPRWLVLHRAADSPEDPPPERVSLGTAVYEGRTVYQHWGFAGFSWYLYRLARPRAH